MLAAGKDARLKAESMAEALGVKLSCVQAVAENQNFEIFDVRYMVSPKTSYRRILAKSLSKMMVLSNITLHQEINVVFKLRP